MTPSGLALSCPGACLSGRSAAWLARLVRDQEAGGSNPLAPTIFPSFVQSLFGPSNLRQSREVQTPIFETERSGGRPLRGFSKGRRVWCCPRLSSSTLLKKNAAPTRSTSFSLWFFLWFCLGFLPRNT